MLFLLLLAKRIQNKKTKTITTRAPYVQSCCSRNEISAHIQRVKHAIAQRFDYFFLFFKIEKLSHLSN